MSEKDTLTYRLLDTSFDSTSSSSDDHYDLPSPTFKWKRKEPRRLIWSNSRHRPRSTRLLVPTLTILLLLAWIYSQNSQFDRKAAIAAAQSRLHRFRQPNYFYPKKSHKHQSHPHVHLHLHPNSPHPHSHSHSKAHKHLASVVPTFPITETIIAQQGGNIPDIVSPIQAESKNQLDDSNPNNVDDINKLVDLIMEDASPKAPKVIEVMATSKVAATEATPSSEASTAKPKAAPTSVIPSKSSRFDHLPTYEEIQSGPKSVWTFQDDYVSDHASCAAMRSKLKAQAVKQSFRGAEHPAASIGRADLFGTTTCSTYEDRFGPYTDRSLGLTYRDSPDALVTDWLLGPKKHFRMEDHQWTYYLQERYRNINDRVTLDMRDNIPDWKALSDRCGLEQFNTTRPQHKTIILHRFFEGFVMTEDKILDMRAMLSEMVINRPYDGWDVRILVELKETPGAFVSQALRVDVLKAMMPMEFWGLVEFWSEDRERAIMPGVSGPMDYGFDISCLLPSQLYSFYHTEYDFVYNWEADLRFMGNYSIFFNSVEDFGRKEGMNIGMEKYSRWYIPGSEESERHWKNYPNEASQKIKEPDLLTFNAILDVEDSGWFHSSTHALEYGSHAPMRTSIVSLLRMSKGLLKAMTLATVEKEKGMQCEAWPSTAVLHSQLPPSEELTFDEELSNELKDIFPLKGVFVPHPVYLREKYEPQDINSQINRRSYFRNEHFMGQSSFNWKSDYPGQVYARWRNGQGSDHCRMPALMHPIKDVGF